MARLKAPTTEHSHDVNLRVRSDVRALIDRAAGALEMSRSAFMIEASRRAAEDALLGQTVVRVDRATDDAFRRVLDEPPAESGAERLLRAPRPWEQ